MLRAALMGRGLLTYSADVPQAADEPRENVPTAIRAAAAIVFAEAVALLGAAVVLLVLIAVHTTTRLWAAFAVVGFALGAAAVLWLCARGLNRLRPSARTPVVLIQLLTLPVTFSLGFQAGRLFIAVPILLAALATLVLLFTPEARQSLDRVL
ncbi:hypothetical protein ACSMXN_10595 [Jatrophihabitans sp. DSM 45814]